MSDDNLSLVLIRGNNSKGETMSLEDFIKDSYSLVRELNPTKTKIHTIEHYGITGLFLGYLENDKSFRKRMMQMIMDKQKFN